jgi:hypothetical protein
MSGGRGGWRAAAPLRRRASRVWVGALAAAVALGGLAWPPRAAGGGRGVGGKAWGRRRADAREDGLPAEGALVHEAEVRAREAAHVDGRAHARAARVLPAGPPLSAPQLSLFC